MGYYTGNGVITGGGEKYTTLRTFSVRNNGSFKVSQKNVYTTTRMSGVSLATAQENHVSANLTRRIGGEGTLAWIVFDADGTRSTPSYTQIGDSNLYELNILNETLTSYEEGA